MRAIINGVVISILVMGFLSAAQAAGTSSSTWQKKEPSRQESKAVTLYDSGMEAHKKGDFKAALSFFRQALEQDRNNPDILNMLAHTQLKLGMIDESLENYNRALKLRPRFAQAREYIGEAYIQAALREIDTLRSYGSEAQEELDDLVSEFKKAASGL